jgi:DNA-nicking Smr family endonuclease
MSQKQLFAGNKYAHLAEPQATLDFHGRGILTEQQICTLAKDFVDQSVSKGFRKILIITGKGLHSEQGPVIEPLLRKFLPTLPAVRSVLTARRDRGGEGALEVELA